MKARIGIDIGGSTTKIVGIIDGKIVNPLHVKATDPVTSTYGAFGRFLSENNIELSQIDKIKMTGVGSSFINNDIYGIKAELVNEFEAIGRGGLYLTGLEKAIIVSMGTGTAIVKASEDGFVHMGGTGVGGGTLLGLSYLMLNMKNFDNIVELAKDGDLSKIDLKVGDITSGSIKLLQPNTTASNFGKISDLATKSDIALGIINLVFQTEGMLAVFAARPEGISDIVLTGNLTIIPQLVAIKDELAKLYNINFTIPEYSEYTTAIGAALEDDWRI